MNNDIISVVIPCYNSGVYLLETIESVNKSDSNFKHEIIIVNDGSTDPETLEILNKIQKKNIRVFHQENRGPASARNTGILHSNAKYILFLDSDNKIKPEFIQISIKVFEDNPDVDIVYGKPEFFGDFTERNTFTSALFDLDKMWFGNYIDMCSVVKREMLVSLGLLDENPILIGHEDWEFWIRAGIQNKKFYFIDDIMFEYRLSKNSLITQATIADKFEKMIRYVYGKNYHYFQNRITTHNNLSILYDSEKKSPFKSFLKNIYRKYFK